MVIVSYKITFTFPKAETGAHFLKRFAPVPKLKTDLLSTTEMFHAPYRPESRNPSNIVHLTQAISREDDNNIQQTILYDEGVGTEGHFYDKAISFVMGTGIDLNLQQLYTFLTLNYTEGDEIYLFGFSRGAFTVRSLASFIHVAGLVRRDHLQFVHEAFELYQSSVSNDSQEAIQFRRLHGNRVPIKALVCFDTVAALGLPLNFGPLGQSSNEYRFHDMRLSPSVENAIHILSVDEERTGMFWDHSGLGDRLSEKYSLSRTNINQLQHSSATPAKQHLSQLLWKEILRSVNLS